MTVHLKKWIRALVYTTLTLTVLSVSGFGIVNISGYCIEQDRFLSDEERVHAEIENVLLHYANILYAYTALPKAGYEVATDASRCCEQGDASRYDGSQGGHAIDSSKLVAYTGVEEFLEINPSCCNFNRSGKYGELTEIDELWPKITGFSAGFVSIKYLVRYRDVNGKIVSGLSAISVNQTNCGRQNSNIY